MLTEMLRPTFTAILWGCAQPLWPSILQEVRSRAEGVVSAHEVQMPAAAEPFWRPYVRSQPQRSTHLLAPAALRSLRD